MKMMIYIAAAMALACTMVQGQSSCRSDFVQAMQCVRREAQVLKQDQSLRAEAQGRIDQCLADQGCSPVNYQADPFAQNPMAKVLKDMMESLTPEQKQCMKDAMKKEVKAKIEECTGDEIPQEFLDAIKQAKQGVSEQQKQQMKQKMERKLLVAQAVKQCVDSGADADALGSCLGDLKDEKKDRVCQIKDDCKQEISQQCVDRAEQFKGKLCECAQEAKAQAEAEAENQGAGGLLGGRFGARRNKMQQVMQQCGIDTSQMRQKMQQAMGCRGLACIGKVQQMMQNGRESMKQLRDSFGGDDQMMCGCE